MNYKYHALLACLLISGCSTNEALNTTLTEDISIVTFTIPTNKTFVEDNKKTINNDEGLQAIDNKEEKTTNNEEIATDKTKVTPSLKKEESKNQTQKIDTSKEKQTTNSISKTETNNSKLQKNEPTKTETKPKNPKPNRTEVSNPEIETKEDSIVSTKDNCQGSGLVFQGNESCTNAINTSYGEVVNLYPGTNKGFDDARTWAMDKFNTDYNGKYLDTHNIDYVEFTDGNFYYVVQFTYIDLEA